MKLNRMYKLRFVRNWQVLYVTLLSKILKQHKKLKYFVGIQHISIYCSLR